MPNRPGSPGLAPPHSLRYWQQLSQTSTCRDSRSNRPIAAISSGLRHPSQPADARPGRAARACCDGPERTPNAAIGCASFRQTRWPANTAPENRPIAKIVQTAWRRGRAYWACPEPTREVANSSWVVRPSASERQPGGRLASGGDCGKLKWRAARVPSRRTHLRHAARRWRASGSRWP